jgi:two-component system, OmpR family, phosphate regulon response regulator PhoB
MGFFKRAERPAALIVEDDVAMRTMLGVFLESLGFDILDCGTGEYALDLAPKHQPDLILLDIMLPGMSGFDIISVLRTRPETRGIPILMCTALRGLENVERCLEAGADDYIQKPIDLKSLQAKIARVLEKRGKKLPR